MGNIYYQHIEITDFGPYITKLTLAMPRPVKESELPENAFNVYVEILGKNGRQIMVPKDFLHRDEFLPSKGYRPVLRAYPSDLSGTPLAESGYVTLEMPYGPLYSCCSAISADFTNINGHEYYTVSNYRITQLAAIGEGKDALTGLVFDSCAGVFNPDRDLFLEDVSHHPVTPLRYGYFVPPIDTGKKPLIVWLHGAGEGGQETAISYTGNKVPALAKEEIQKKFGGAFIFSPQCPTMWLDDGSMTYGTSGKSIYVEALKFAIDEFIYRFAGAIDTDRIYVGGDSNGGFMTMRMILDYPDFFAAAFPICEALFDDTIPDEKIRAIKDLPIWFTHAKDDPIVPPAKTVVPTYNRLLAAGAKKVVFTFWDGIYDMHGLFKDANGNPWHYMGHFAWIPVLNNDCKVDFDGQPVVCDGRELDLFDWIALQHR